MLKYLMQFLILLFLLALVALFSKKYQISKLALFGSYSRDENRDDSDVDIAIETSFHTKVDIVHLRDKMNMALRRRIEKDGIYV